MIESRSDSRSTIHRGYEIVTDEDGHITVWCPDRCEHWTEATMAAAKAQVDLLLDPLPTFFGIPNE